jgi:hypothetical protein
MRKGTSLSLGSRAVKKQWGFVLGLAMWGSRELCICSIHIFRATEVPSSKVESCLTARRLKTRVLGEVVTLSPLSDSLN